MILPAAEFMPDMPDLSEATSIASNVIALTPQSYGPLRSLSPFSSNAIDSTCRGMGSAQDTALAHFVFAGTTAKLWLIDTSGTAWLDTSGTTYAAGAGESWRFAQFKNLELATDFTDPIQSYDMIGGGVFSNLAAAAPLARYLAVAKNFVIAANTYDPVGGLNTARLWWSAFNDPTNWPTPGSALAQQTQSDFNDLLGPQGQITGLAPNLAGCDCAVFFERGVFRMIYSGPPDIFDFYAATSAKGCPAPSSIVPFGAGVYYYGEDGFYFFDGNQLLPIGANKIDQWFAATLDPTGLASIVGAPDVNNKAICWLFRSIYATTALSDMMLIYRWDIQRWSVGAITAEWLSRIPVTTTLSGSPPSIAPLEAGQLQLAAVDSGGFLAFFNGSNLPAQVGTKVVQITPGGRTFVNTSRPLVNSAPLAGPILTALGLDILTATGSPILSAPDGAVITVAMSARNTYQDTETFGPDVAPNIMGDCPQRSDGRYHRGRITVSSGIWSTLAGLDVGGIPAGLR